MSRRKATKTLYMTVPQSTSTGDAPSQYFISVNKRTSSTLKLEPCEFSNIVLKPGRTPMVM
eukprot:16958-Heterococcus_DN1.PRE.3